MVATKKPCPEGKERNPDSGRCRNIDQADKGKGKGKARSSLKVANQKPCPPGKERNIETNRCRKISTRSTKRSRSRSRGRSRSRRSRSIIALSGNTKLPEESVVPLRRGSKPTVQCVMGEIARIEGGGTAVIRLRSDKPNKARSRSRSRSRGSKVTTSDSELHVNIAARSPSNQQLALRVGEQVVIVDGDQGTIETAGYLVGVQSIHDSPRETVVNVTIAQKPEPEGYVKKYWKNATIGILIAIIIFLLGNALRAKSCIVNVTNGFPAAGQAANASTETVMSQFAFMPAGFKLANLQVLAAPTWNLLSFPSYFQLPHLSNIFPNMFSGTAPLTHPEVTPVRTPSAAANATATASIANTTANVRTITRYVNVYNTKQELAKRELEAVFSEAATTQLYTSLRKVRGDLTGLQGIISNLQTSVEEKERGLALLRQDVERLTGSASLQNNTISGLQQNITARDSSISALRAQSMTLKGNVTRLSMEVQAYEKLQINHDRLVERFDNLTITSSAEAAVSSNVLIAAEQELNRYKEVVKPALETEIAELKDVEKALRQTVADASRTETHYKGLYEKAEAKLLKLEAETNVTRIDLESQLQVARIQLSNVVLQSDNLINLAKAVDATVLKLRQMGIAMPTTTESETSLQQLIEKRTQDASLSSDAIGKEINKIIAFHDEHIARLQGSDGHWTAQQTGMKARQHKGNRERVKGNNDSAVGAANREKLLRDHRNARRTVLKARDELQKERVLSSQTLTLANDARNLWQNKFVALRAVDKSMTELVAPTIVAVRRPDGTYSVEDNVEILLKVAPNLKGTIDELRSCLTSKLNGSPNRKIPSPSISCTFTTRVAVKTGSEPVNRDFQMTLLRTSDLVDGTAPVQRLEFLVQEKEEPRIVVQTVVETTILTETSYETMTTVTTATETVIPPTPTAAASMSALTTPAPSTAGTVQKLMAKTLQSGETKIISHTKTARPSASSPSPSASPSAGGGSVQQSKGSNGQPGTFVLENKRVSLDVCDRAYPLSEYFTLLDTCSLNGKGEPETQQPAVSPQRESWTQLSNRLSSYQIPIPVVEPEAEYYYPQPQIDRKGQPIPAPPVSPVAPARAPNPGGPRQIEEKLPENLSEWFASFFPKAPAAA